MRILFLSDDFPPEILGGAGRVAFNLAKGLEKAGHQIFIITTCREKNDEGDINYQGLKIFRIYSKYHERWRAYLGLYNPQTVGKVKKIIQEIKPDIVHAHNIHYYLSYYCLKLAKKYSQAVFLTAHDAMLIHYGKWIPGAQKDYKITFLDQVKEARKRYNPFRNIIIRYFLSTVDKIFSVSNALKELLEANSIKNIETIHNGIGAEDLRASLQDIEKFKERYKLKNKRIILFGGRLSQAKGGEKIISTMGKVLKEIAEAVLLVVGREEGYGKRMFEIVKTLNLDKSIVFVGWLTGDDLKTVYGSCDVVVVPSLYFDPFPTTNLEAMACKKPVIGTCFGGTPEIVQDGVTGYIVNPFNIEQMSEKIIDLLKNPKKARQFGRAGFERVKKHFSLDSQVAKTISWYKKYYGI